MHPSPAVVWRGEGVKQDWFCAPKAEIDAGVYRSSDSSSIAFSEALILVPLIYGTSKHAFFASAVAAASARRAGDESLPAAMAKR